MPQGSIFGHLFLDRFLCDISLFPLDIPVANYKGNNNLYWTSLKISNVLIKSEHATKTLLQWFKDNRMKKNQGKLFVNNNKERFQIKIISVTLSKSKSEKLLEVKKDYELNFNEHASMLR